VFQLLVQSSAGAERAVVVVGLGELLTNVRFDGCAGNKSGVSDGPLTAAVLPDELKFVLEPGSCGIKSGGAAMFVPMLVQPPVVGVVDGLAKRLRSFVERAVCESDHADEAFEVAGALVGQEGGGARLPRGDVAGAGGDEVNDGGDRFVPPNVWSATLRTLLPAVCIWRAAASTGCVVLPCQLLVG
jgi:hypothetical protein